MSRTHRSLCFTVVIDIRKPLSRGMNVKVGNKAIWVYFKYVKLPEFCLGCEKLGHVLKTCEEADSDTPKEA